MTRALFVQSRHPNAPKEGEGQIYMPTAILTAMARTLAAGGDVTFCDENYAPLTDAEIAAADVVGIHTVGPSWVPSSLELQQRILAVKPSMTILQGGQTISGLDWDAANNRPLVEGPRFRRLFGSARNGNIDTIVHLALGLSSPMLPKESTSLIAAYETLEDALLQRYLSDRFSLYVSQGCRFACSFCCADRTQTDANQRVINALRVGEKYRDTEILERDLDWLLSRAEDFNIKEMMLYMSNLDLSQKPEKLAQFAQAVQRVRNRHDVDLTLTGLSTTSMYVELAKKYPAVLEAIYDAGLRNIGFGVEGIGEFLTQINKRHNIGREFSEDIGGNYNVIKHAVAMGFLPEILLTPGHAAQSDEEVAQTLTYAQHLLEDFGDKIIIRPYAAKTFAPGNDEWKSGRYDDQIEQLLECPELFQNLDFNILLSTLTEPNPVRRSLVNGVYEELVRMSKGAAYCYQALEADMAPKERELVRKINEGMYDH